MEDTADEEISPFLQKAFEFIEEQRKTKNVLIHCIAGVSRSSTIIAFYLMKKYGLSVEESI
jgi:dual specificity phosphatase 12